MVYTLPDVGAPDYRGAPTTTQFKTKKVAFEDGYEMRAPSGLFNKPRQWQLTWSGLTKDQKDELEDFLRARGGYQSFEWTLPNDNETYKCVCEQLKSSEQSFDSYQVTATFREVP